jgi:hypothetical protein
MKSKVLALTLLTTFVALACVPASYAQSNYSPVLDPDGNPYTTVIQVNASGTLAATTIFTVDAGDGLEFTPAAGETAATAEQVVKLNFSDNHAGFQSIIVSTENPTVQITTATGTETLVRAGLITDDQEDTSVPLHWVVFDDAADAEDWEFVVFPDGFTQYDAVLKEDVDVSGKIDNRIQFYVVDRNQADFDTEDVLGFTTVIAGVAGTEGTLAKAPWDIAPTVDDDADADTPSLNDGEPRSTSDGEVFLKFGADYTGAPAASYYTNTLTLDLVTIG